METDHSWIILLVIFVVIPFFFWFRVRSINRRKELVTVRCPHCDTDQRLRKVQNYTCRKCGTPTRFFDDEGSPLNGVNTYQCEACGGENFMGVLTCTACGKGNQAGLPK